jgi:DNA-binding NarL/FixJ family response regulator
MEQVVLPVFNAFVGFTIEHNLSFDSPVRLNGRGASVQRIRVAVAENNPEITRILVDILEPDFNIVGMFFTGMSALQEVQGLNPDVFILDISLGDLSGFEVVEALRQQNSSTKVVFLTVHENLEFIRAAFDLGARGYVFKSRMSLDLAKAIRAVSRGKRFFPSLLSPAM